MTAPSRPSIGRAVRRMDLALNWLEEAAKAAEDAGAEGEARTIDRLIKETIAVHVRLRKREGA